MTTIQKIHDCIDRTDYAQYFVLMRKAVGKNYLLATLEQEYITGRYGTDLSQRMRTLADNLLTALPTAHKFLTDFLKPTDFVGRQAELEQLHALLEAGEASVIVNGLGGVGKTTLARQYVHQYKENYHNIVWLKQQNTLLSALITNERLTENMDFTTETEEDRFKRVMRELENTEGKNLLVIDNYEQKDTDNKLAILERFRNVQFNHWRVLFTSREQVRHFQPIDLSFLPTHEAIELFTLHCGNKTFDEKTLELLLEEVKNHTLTIELLAKSYRKNKYTNNLNVLLKAMQNKEYDSQVMKWEIQTERNKDNVSLYKHLLSLFNMEKWTTEEQYILKQFAVLPSLPIDVTKLLEWLKDDQFIYGDVIENLTNKGWLSTKDQQQYEMHRLLKVLIQKHLGIMWKDVKVMVESVKEELEEDKINANPLASRIFIEYINSFLEIINFNQNEIEIAYLYSRNGFILYANSLYDNAISYHTKAMNIIKEKKGTKNEDYAVVLNELGIIYDIKTNYEKAIEMYNESLSITKDLYGDNNIKYANCLHCLAYVYSSQENYNYAHNLYKETMSIYEKNNECNSKNYATIINNLANLHKKISNYADAEFYYNKALSIRKDLLGEKHPDYANSLHNLASLYKVQGKFDESKKKYEEVIQILENVLGNKHIYYGYTLLNFGFLNYEMNLYNIAYKNTEESYNIFKNMLGNEHSDTKRAEEQLEQIQKFLQDQTNTEL